MLDSDLGLGRKTAGQLGKKEKESERKGGHPGHPGRLGGDDRPS